MPLRVLKLGGSLLDFDDLRSALRRWRSAQPPGVEVLVVGGGDLAESIRALDRRLAIGEEAAHWLCIRAMGVTARLAASLWPELTLATQRHELLHLLRAGNGPVAFDSEDFLRREERELPGVRLERSWRVTSDSIAARLAAVLAAEELVLLKSTLPERAAITCREAAEVGYVDEYFPVAARSLPCIRAVDLRSADFRELRIHPREPSDPCSLNSFNP